MKAIWRKCYYKNMERLKNIKIDENKVREDKNVLFFSVLSKAGGLEFDRLQDMSKSRMKKGRLGFLVCRESPDMVYVLGQKNSRGPFYMAVGARIDGKYVKIPDTTYNLGAVELTFEDGSRKTYQTTIIK